MNHLIYHVRYSRWATGRTLESVRALSDEQMDREVGGSYGNLRGTLTHIYQADQAWFARLMARPTGPLAEFPPAAARDAWERDWLELLDRYVAFAEGLDDDAWGRVMAYRDSRGNPYQSPVWQMLGHWANHGSYHRGQVATLLRQLGTKAAGTDLIFYYRESEA